MNYGTIGSDNGLSPGRRHAIIWTNVGILLIGPLRTNFSEILIEIQTFSLKIMHLKMSSSKWRPFCPWEDELTLQVLCHSGIPEPQFQWVHLHMPWYITVLNYKWAYSGLDTNGCPLGNSKYILLSDNLNICLWLSACQVEKINQLNNSCSNVYQRLSQPEATFRKYKHI